MADSPTQRSLKLMRDRGYLCEVVEHWNPWSKTRKDLFGFIDILCIKEGQVIGVQTTSKTNISARYNKIKEHDNIWWVLDSGIRVLIQGWGKNKSGRWEMKEIEVRIESGDSNTTSQVLDTEE